MRALPRFAAGIGLAAAAYALFVRPRLLRWGATAEDLREPLPGADIVPGARRGSTMAVTIDAPPSAVWPWLVQMGFDRAGWYSWDRLDHAGIPSADELHPEWQSLTVGQRLPSTPDRKYWFDVAAADREHLLALRVLMSGIRQYDSAGPRPRAFTDTLWAFKLKELPGGRTRLIVSVYQAKRRQPIASAMSLLFWEPAHVVMQTRQFANLKRRAEGAVADTGSGAPL